MKEFFGFGGYQRPAEGFLSWQHLTFVGSLMAVMILLGVLLGLRNKNREDRVKNRVLIGAALDFVFIFGLLGAAAGTIGAGQNYNAYPVLSFDNVVSGLTHCISGFASLYIGFARMTSMKKKNVGITFAILLKFCVMAYVANVLLPYNYMFLMRGDGTPYDILYNLVGGSPVWYPLGVVGLFLAYIVLFYWIFFLIAHRKSNKTE